MRDDWAKCELGDVFSIVTGNTPSKKDADNYGTDLPFIKPPDINNARISTASEYLSNKGRLKARVLPENSVLVTCIGNLGRVAINKEEVSFNQQINALEPSPYVKSKFTFYIAQSNLFRNQLESKSTSTTVSLVNKSNFSSIKIPLAPLPEQRAIVAKIEALFSDLDQGIADLKTAEAQLKIYRQAVLKKAFEGELESVLAKDITEVISDGDHQAPPKAPEGIPFIIISNIKNNEIDFSNTKFVPLSYYEGLNDKRRPEKGDVLFTVTGSFGIPVLVSSDKKFCFQRHIGLLRPSNRVDQKYLFYVLQSPDIYRQACDVATGTAQKTVSLKGIRSFKIPLCSLAEQHQIVREIETRLSVCDEVEGTIFQSLSTAEALRQSILKKAFEGRLLSESELAACRAEPDWEPAAALLEKIRGEKKG